MEQIEKVLDEKVRPQLIEHGGEIRSVEFKDGIYRFEFLGACAGCPSAYLTTEELVAKELQDAIPEIQDAVLIQSVSEDLLEQARKILHHEF